jgi:rhodanese-related sulfurtransferase
VSSARAALTLIDAGWTGAKALGGGLYAWEDLGYPLVNDPPALARGVLAR